MPTNLNPRVSVVMPVYNTDTYIKQAIQSILDQTFTDFELIIIDDASTDRSAEIVKSFTDPRIIFIQNEKKGTIVSARNQALSLARGEFIAPLDSDDIAYPDRLTLQVDFLEKNKDFGIVGGGVEVINKDGVPTGVKWREIIPSEKMPIRSLFNNCFSQSAVLIRKQAIPKEGYVEYSEDYGMWIKILRSWKGINLPHMLLKYRSHEENSSHRTRPQLNNAVQNIIISQIKNLGIQPTDEEIKIHRSNYGFSGTDSETKQFIEKREAWLTKLSLVNKKVGLYKEKLFNEVMAERFLTTLESNAHLGLYGWKVLVKSPLIKDLNLNEGWKKIVKFLIKSLLKRSSF